MPRLIVCITIAVLAALVVAWCVLGPDAALSSEPSPSPSASPSATPPPEYASAELVASAMKSRKAAVKARRALSRVRRCFRSHMPVRVAATPLRGALKATWEKARARWRAQARGWREKARRLHHRMTHPGGSSNGVRWKPLMRHVGWGESCLSTLAAIVMRESSGRARAYNPSGAAGLCQLMPGWYRGQWGIPAGDPFDPEYNLLSALRIWRKCGWSPWAVQ